VEKLTFRFEDENAAVILDGWAHRPSCPRPAGAAASPSAARACRILVQQLVDAGLDSVMIWSITGIVRPCVSLGHRDEVNLIVTANWRAGDPSRRTNRRARSQRRPGSLGSARKHLDMRTRAGPAARHGQPHDTREPGRSSRPRQRGSRSIRASALSPLQSRATGGRERECDRRAPLLNA